MKGIELSRKFYEEYGKPMIEDSFAEYKDRIAVGLVGHGSECFGFDDDISRDHDFNAGFNIFITEEDDRAFGFKLFREYEKLPTEYLGIKTENKSLFGSSGKGVKTIKDFYKNYTQSGDVPDLWQEWLYTPDFYFAEATNGEVFVDTLGEFTRIREGIKNGMPDDVRKKKLASCFLMMAQTGQYNYKRCLEHNEKGGAFFALSGFCENYAKSLYIISGKFAPYYKWLIKGVENLDGFADKYNEIVTLMSNPFDSKNNFDIIEKLSAELIKIGENMYNLPHSGDYLEPYAYLLNDTIKAHELRNLAVIQE